MPIAEVLDGTSEASVGTPAPRLEALVARAARLASELWRGAEERPAAAAPARRTTVIVSNLPAAVASQDGARGWLDEQGFEGTYDFLFFLPGKGRRGRGGQGADAQARGHFIVNFRATSFARRCARSLHGRPAGGAALKVATAKKQGRDALVEHFADVFESSTVHAPWVFTDATGWRSA
ncbi:unnamed protein product [Prorocentrum cordatum]|uniref:RRM domain-containing protein n=1 Tax=Prorocentrum cordatum TaxID=2364126 RepID=A0ABN9QDC8_9DINO|nr:unnamed protein product [Polarella glacialis]